MTGVLFGVDLPVVATKWVSASGGTVVFHDMNGLPHTLTLDAGVPTGAHTSRFLSGPTDLLILESRPPARVAGSQPPPDVVIAADVPVSPPPPTSVEVDLEVAREGEGEDEAA